MKILFLFYIPKTFASNWVSKKNISTDILSDELKSMAPEKYHREVR